jgi:hypothetical protein
MGIRVIRILEYEYRTTEIAVQDMASWTHTQPKARSKDMRMKSAVLPVDHIEWEPPPVEPATTAITGLHNVERNDDGEVIFSGNQACSEDLSRLFFEGDQRFEPDERVQEIVIKSYDGSTATWTRMEDQDDASGS